ncbi:pyridoxal phosphate-dependent decarboxylase family protein [Aquabacterium sp.]|uniref:pyridoxal phosphate-dependent decarboxylase family protein n=1 Tax=Aquabacterium sp. TaxID=1872578 RepID=UPI002B9A9CE6|nr:aminotransferase class V-fold PLP-dependent enzyme [Aquabacterium sp.]HSW06971.1 aminotransferase class V-fold PLP-dependent enzyme [Aquabacterium sp.]
MTSLLDDAARRASRYLDSLPTRAVAPQPEAIAGLAALDEPLPEQPQAPEAVLHRLDEIGSPATSAMAGGRFFGYVVGGALPVSVAANWLATAWDQNAAAPAATPGVAAFEQVALRWLLEILDLPREAGGAFVTGATQANLCGLAAARHAVLARAGWDVEADGLFGAPPITVIVGAEAHPTLFKALGVLGLGRNRVVRVATDAQGRLRAERLPRMAGPSILCVQAGNVNTGTFDPIEALCNAAHEAGAWVHVDGAFGLWSRAAPSLQPLCHGAELADSWATDAHKWLNVPYDSGLAFVRDGDALRAAMSVTAAYLPAQGAVRAPSDYTPELSRRARGVDVWAALSALGRSGVAEMIERCCRHARRFAQGLAAAGFTIHNEVVLNQVLVSFGDASITRQVIDQLQAEGTCWCGVTEWQGHTAMRISVCSWATTDEDVERSLAAMLRVAGLACTRQKDGERA